MTGSYKATYVQCPMFKNDDGKGRIVCEGLIGKGSSIQLTYRFKKDYEIQMDTFCCDHFDRCEIYRVLIDMYDKE